MTRLESRHLQWPDCFNVRDLGGLPTGDGETIHRGAVIRSDHHDVLTDEGVAALRASGVSRIVDLRRENECDDRPSPFAQTSLYCNVPVQDPADPDNADRTLGEIYCTMLDRRPGLFATAVAAVAEAPPGTVVVHCAAGKDRTGLVAALALTLAGVQPDVVAADYALSAERLRVPSARRLAEVSDPDLRERLRRLQVTAPETMLATLAHLTAQYGGVGGYLEHGGCGAEVRAALRRRLRDGEVVG